VPVAAHPKPGWSGILFRPSAGEIQRNTGLQQPSHTERPFQKKCFDVIGNERFGFYGGVQPFPPSNLFGKFE